MKNVNVKLGDELDTPYALVLHHQLEIEKGPSQFDHVYGNDKTLQL